MGFIEVTIFTKKSEFSKYLKNKKFLIIGLYISIIKLFCIEAGNESNTYFILYLYFDLLYLKYLWILSYKLLLKFG